MTLVIENDSAFKHPDWSYFRITFILLGSGDKMADNSWVQLLTARHYNLSRSTRARRGTCEFILSVEDCWWTSK